MEYPKPSLTVDIVVQRTKNDVLLIKRKKNPFQDYWALPGGFFDPLSDESIVHAAQRELFEEVNIGCSTRDFVFHFYLDEKSRDPRGRVISFVFLLNVFWTGEVKAADDATEYQWASLDDIRSGRIELAFDHFDAIKHILL